MFDKPSRPQQIAALVTFEPYTRKNASIAGALDSEMLATKYSNSITKYNK